MISVDSAGEPRIGVSGILRRRARGAVDAGDATEAQTIGSIGPVLKDAVGRRMIADVPLGAFLSGGIEYLDRGCADAERRASRPVRTFTIGLP